MSPLSIASLFDSAVKWEVLRLSIHNHLEAKANGASKNNQKKNCKKYINLLEKYMSDS